MELMILAIVFGMLGLLGWSLVDIIGRPEHQWKAIGQDRALWVLVIFWLPGLIGYLAFVRPKFSRIVALTPLAAYPMLNAAPPPGWYPDPQGMPVMRWFDGRQWTPQTAALGNVLGAQGYGQAVVPTAGTVVGPAPGAAPQHYPDPPA